MLRAGDGSLSAFRLHSPTTMAGSRGAVTAAAWPDHGGAAVGAALSAAGERDAAPALGDLDGDGAADLLVGLRSGELRAYRNVGSDEAPAFQRPSDPSFYKC